MGFIFALASRSSYGQLSNISPRPFDRVLGPLRSFGERWGERVNRP
jgi:hypothetical protein